MNFQTPWLKAIPLGKDLDERKLSSVKRAVVNDMVQEAMRPEQGRDPKACVIVRDEDNVFQCIVNVQARPGNAWPEETQRLVEGTGP